MQAMITALELRDSDKTVTYAGSVEEVETQCEALAILDKETEQKKRLTWIGFVAGALFCLGAIVADSWLLTVPGALIFGGSGIYYLRINSDDIEDRKLEAARWILDTLKPELKASRPVKLDIDFRGYDNYAAEANWLALKMTLDNGVGLAVTVSTHFKRKERSKRKYTKIKDKIHERIAVTFTPPKGQQFGASGGQPVQRRFGALNLRSAKRSAKAATFVFATNPVLRVKGRGGWSAVSSGDLVDGKKSVVAVITGFRSLVTNPAGGAA